MSVVPNLALALALIVGVWLRFSHADWDATNHLHPDERAILFVAQTVALPGRLVDLFDPLRSPLNPLRGSDGAARSYPYGHLPLYLMVGVQRGLSLPCEWFASLCVAIRPDSFGGRLLNVDGQPRFTHLTYVGRALSALADTLSILAAGLLAGRLADSQRDRAWARALAASCTSLAVLHIQNAHFGTVDTAVALFATLTVWLLVRYAQEGRLSDSLLAGVCMGLAAGCKVSAGLLIVPLYVAHVRPAAGMRGRWWGLRLPFWGALGAAVLSFSLTNPYALLDPVPFVRGVVTQMGMASGALDWPFTRQYAGSLPIWYFVEQQARWGLGFPLTVTAYAGLVWWVAQAIRTRSRGPTVALVWVGVMLLGIGMQYVKFPRYMLPLTPTLLALAGAMLAAWLRRGWGWVLGGLVLGPTALYALAFVRMYEQPHPWVAASEWIYRSLPPGTVIAVERWDDPLPLDIVVDGAGFQREQVYDTRLLDPFAEPDDQGKLDTLLTEVAEADYLILSSNRLYGTIARLERRYPLTAAYYRALFAGKLGFVLERSFGRGPNLAGLSLIDDPFRRAGLTDPLGGTGCAVTCLRLGFADESFTVYDHPLVLVFANRERLPAERMRGGLTP